MPWTTSKLSADCAVRSLHPQELLPKDTFGGDEQQSCASFHLTTSSCFQHLHHREMSCIPSSFCWGSLNHLYERDVSVQGKKRPCKRKKLCDRSTKLTAEDLLLEGGVRWKPSNEISMLDSTWGNATAICSGFGGRDHYLAASLSLYHSLPWLRLNKTVVFLFFFFWDLKAAF